LGCRVREAPLDLDEDALLSAIRHHWTPDVDAVEHLPVGFGAHHWRASTGGQPTYFVTLDGLDERHSAASLEAAYAAAAALARELDFVLAPAVSGAGRFTAAFGRGALSVTPWVEGTTPEHLDLGATAAALTRLHQAAPPVGVPEWRTLVTASLAVDLAELSRSRWDSGPYGERARTALRGRLDAIAEWTDAYHGLAEVAHRRDWVMTHGEPHERNMRIGSARNTHTWFLDWETVKLAPAERDWRTLLERGWAPHPGLDAAMLDLFDLEWRLDEISQYAARFAAPHTGSASDRVAMGALLHELTRAPFETSAPVNPSAG
jgi:spectinomycin phosphotransferase